MRNKFRNVLMQDLTPLLCSINLAGSAVANLLLGGGGDDALWGEVGGDTLIGGADNDVTFGDEGADPIYVSAWYGARLTGQVHRLSCGQHPDKPVFNRCQSKPTTRGARRRTHRSAARLRSMCCML
jgi:hypothetical protein